MCRAFFFLFSLFGCFTVGHCEDDDSSGESPFFQDVYENEYEYEDGYEYWEGGNTISYGGITIECDAGCGSVDDPHFEIISETLFRAIRRVSKGAYPLWVGSDLLEGFEAWEKSGEFEYQAFDWPQTGGFLIEDLPYKTYSFRMYEEFLDLATALRQDVQFYYSDIDPLKRNLYKLTLSKLRAAEGQYGNVDFGEREEPEFFSWGHWTTSSRSLPDAIKSVQQHITHLKSVEYQLSFEKSYQDAYQTVDKAVAEVDLLYRDMFLWCLENHQLEGLAFSAAIEHLLVGDFEEAMDKIRCLLEVGEEQDLGDQFFAKLYLLKGQVESEASLYADAILDLTKAIEKDSSLKEAYLERASAYFELGQFDEAIEDFVKSGIRSTPWSHPTQWGLGMAAGMVQGGYHSLEDFIPSLMGALKELANGLWAFTKNPVTVSQELVQGAQSCVNYLRKQSLQNILQDIVPELRTLLENHDKLSDFERGQMVGFLIGKYGTDIFFTKYTTGAAKSYYDLKKANQLMTLEALASPQTTQEILTRAAERWALREQVVKNGNLKIHPGKQGKHIEGHPNYQDLCQRDKNPSIFKHPEPQRLIDTYAGTGRKVRGDIPGVEGYQEVVNFEEFIGYAVDVDTKVQTATSWGKIHYSQEGVHIVPHYPVTLGE